MKDGAIVAGHLPEQDNPEAVGEIIIYYQKGNEIAAVMHQTHGWDCNSGRLVGVALLIQHC
jgi:hypothetical protein